MCNRRECIILHHLATSDYSLANRNQPQMPLITCALTVATCDVRRLLATLKRTEQSKQSRDNPLKFVRIKDWSSVLLPASEFV
eukprot:scaffold96007_cov41-Prasinocladus_malaysianus.AAC.1